MARLIVGIFESCTPAQLEAALRVDCIDMSRLKLVTGDARSNAHDDSALDFVFIADGSQVESPAEEITHGTGMLSDSGGTGVPGLSAPRTSLVGFSGHGSANYLAGFPIPEDEIGNFNDAVDAGRCVVAYAPTPADDAEKIKASLKTAGL